MYIVGTAGHIDHGKTALIASLTGTDCDRLPEEKARGMTVDIGFAFINFPQVSTLGTVGIIDVPGHERFIRNMAAGAWGMDCALLVVAADDGWMPQTSDHLKVLTFFGIKKLIAVVNKIDIADEDTIALVEEDIRVHLAATIFSHADIVRVSAKTGLGIEDLKTAIAETLKTLPKTTDAGKPYLYIDRIFTSKGHGTIAAGTLKNGSLKENDSVVILPINADARIKRIESHYVRPKEGSGIPARRTALNLAGVASDELSRGFIVCKKNFFTQSKSIVARVTYSDKPIKTNTYIEFLTGTALYKAKLITLAEPNIVRFDFAPPCCCFPGQVFVLTMPGGFNIAGGGVVLLSSIEKQDKKRIKENIGLADKGDTKSLLAFFLSVRGWIERDEIKNMFCESNLLLDKYIDELTVENKVVVCSSIIMWAEFYESAAAGLIATAKKTPGVNSKEASFAAGLDIMAGEAALAKLVQSELIAEKDGKYFAEASLCEDELPASVKALLQKLFTAGSSGLDIGRGGIAAAKKDIDMLIKLGYGVSLEGGILYHKDTYDALAKKVMSLFDSQDKVLVTDVKNAVGLSRKYAIPLLNKMESDGWVKRLGDFRIKV